METSTPAGDLAVFATDDGIVRAAGFCPPDHLLARLEPALRDLRTESADPSHPVAAAVRAWADGDLPALDAVAVSQPGGSFLQQAWRSLRTVPPGTTVSYAALARAAGRPAAVRAAGSACARNLVAPFVPCHRVVRSDGSLGGYYYGLATKQALLGHEAAAAAHAAVAHA